jgi:hypothetical protein
MGEVIELRIYGVGHGGHADGRGWKRSGEGLPTRGVSVGFVWCAIGEYP